MAVEGLVIEDNKPKAVRLTLDGLKYLSQKTKYLRLPSFSGTATVPGPQPSENSTEPPLIFSNTIITDDKAIESGMYGDPIRPHRGGWRWAVTYAASAASFVFGFNLIFTISMIAKYGSTDGIGTIYTGDCALVHRWSTAIHLIINVLSTGLLAASNFTMQCLSSPTRTEVDTAHAKRKSLDIGLSSFQNLFHMRPLKAVLWAGLVVSTMPLHLLWNSSVFTTIGAQELSYIVVDDSFFNGSYQYPDLKSCREADGVPSIAEFHEGYVQGRYSERLEPADCIKKYGASFLTDRRNLIAVTRPTLDTAMSPGCTFNQSGTRQTWNGSSPVLGYSNEYYNIGTSLSYDSFAWLCEGYFDDINDPFFWTNQGGCNSDAALGLLRSNGSWYLRPRDYSERGSWSSTAYEIDYCLSEVDITQKCQLQFVSYILYVVVICNAIKVICMILTIRIFWSLEEPLLATVGDAVESFMQQPDKETRDWCLLDRYRLEFWRNAKSGQAHAYSTRATNKKLFSATSKLRWTFTMLLCTLYLMIGVGLLVAGVSYTTQFMTLSQIWKLGFGAPDPNTVPNRGMPDTSSLLKNILQANSFQLALSMTYFLYNSLYTAQCGALEWATYAAEEKKPLRVSYPRGQQKSSLYLQLPYQYSVPLIIMSGLMHFLISQSIFLVIVRWYDQHEVLDDIFWLASFGYSPIAILVTVNIGAVLILAQIAHSFRHLRSKIPIHGNSSVVISAVCHLSYQGFEGLKRPELDSSAGLEPIRWGATLQPGDKSEVGHCSFTEEAVELPIDGMKYK